MESALTSELAWESPFGLGFVIIAFSIFLLALGKVITYIAVAVKELRKK